MVRRPLQCLLGIVLVVSACDKPERTIGADNLIIARINKADVPRNSFHTYLRYSVYLPDAVRADETGGEAQRSEFSDEVNSRLLDGFLVERALLNRAQSEGLTVTREEVDRFARATGLGSLDEMQTELPLTQREFLERYLEESCLIKQLIARSVVAPGDLSDDVLRARYDSSPASFTVPRRYRIRLLHLDNFRDADEARTRIGGSGEKFLEVTAELTTDEEEQGKDLGLWDESHLPDAFSAALANLGQGQITDLVEDPDGGYNIIYVGAVLPAKTLPFEEVRERIRRDLTTVQRLQATQTFTDAVRNESKIEIVSENLGFVYVPRPEPAQPSTETQQPSPTEVGANGGPT